VANVEANKAYSEHLEDLDRLGRAVANFVTDARFMVRRGEEDAMATVAAAHSTLEEFRTLAWRLTRARSQAEEIAKVTGSRGAAYSEETPEGRITAVWGEA
jgi:hypothetical protein